MKGTNQVIVLFCFLDSVAWLLATGFLYLRVIALRVSIRLDGYWERIIIMINRKKKKQIPGLNTRVMWNIDPRTRVLEDDRKNIKKIRQNGNKLCHSFEN